MPDRVLVIDDDTTITEVVSLLLKSHGFEAITANDGETGTRMVREHRPDLVVLDLTMPGMDGWEVCRRVRAFSSVPILILSAVADQALISQARQAGADAHLVKPAPGELLVGQIHTLLKKTKPNL